jgi:hypothetical protein
LGSGETAVIKYGDGGGASGATAPDTPGDYTFLTKSRVSDAGVLTQIASSPVVTVLEEAPPPPPPSPTNVIWHQLNYWFRDDDGDEISATGFGEGNLTKDQDAVMERKEEFRDTFRLRIGLKADADDGTLTPQLEFKEFGPRERVVCEGAIGWKKIGFDERDPFVLNDSPHFSKRVSTTQQIVGGPNFEPGLLLEEDNPAPAKFFEQNDRTEYEWSLKDTMGFTREAVYAFRLSDGGSPFGIYDSCPIMKLAGGPGGTIGGVQPTIVIFSGMAYPGAKVMILIKDFGKEIPLKQDLVVSPEGDFYIEFVGILQSIYSFGLVAYDKDGRSSQTKIFRLNTVSDSLIGKNIFLPPTIGFSRAVVSQGDSLLVVGYASPGSEVEVEIDRRFREKTETGEDGFYKLAFNTSELSFGYHSARARQIGKDGKKSEFSVQKTFSVSQLRAPQADFNNDGIINISDWSIFLARWRSSDPTLRMQNDLNGDGRIDISDFSVFIQNFKRQ